MVTVVSEDRAGIPVSVEETRTYEDKNNIDITEHVIIFNIRLLKNGII